VTIKKCRLLGCDAPRGSCKNRRFGGTCRLHHRDDKNRRARNNITNNYWLLTLFYIADRASSLWWRRYIPPNRRFLQEPLCITSQMLAFFRKENVRSRELSTFLSVTKIFKRNLFIPRRLCTFWRYVTAFPSVPRLRRGGRVIMGAEWVWIWKKTAGTCLKILLCHSLGQTEENRRNSQHPTRNTDRSIFRDRGLEVCRRSNSAISACTTGCRVVPS
jgi:hypothetical protein